MTPTRMCTVLVLLLLTSITTAHAEPLRVAVMPFDNASGDASLDPLGTGLQAMLTTDLANVNAYSLIERQRLAEIQAELSLQKTAAIDKTTAAKVGKLAGASHLIAGAVTVMGTAMRLDARLFDITTGEVVLTAKIEGEKDAFFELEKQLVQQIIDATRAKVSAKERASIARIHTSDFGAFARFSEGVFAFDHADYDKAIQALKDAATMDEEFKLAKLTLDDYEVLVQKLEARAALIDASARKAKALAADATVKGQQPIFDRLWHIAKTATDPKTDDARRERLAALYQLAYLYGDVNGTVTGKVGLRKFEDHWLLERTSDALAKAYYAEAIKAWPMAPLFITGDYGFQVPIEEKDYPQEEAQWLERFFGKDDALKMQHELLDDLLRDGEFSKRLHLDTVEQARLIERAYQLGQKLDLAGIEKRWQSRKNWWRENMSGRLGSAFRRAGLFDESTKYFAEVGRLASESYAVKGAATEVERNKEITTFIKAHPSPRVREWLMLRDFDIGSSAQDYTNQVVAALEQKPPGIVGRAALAADRDCRRSGDAGYILVDDIPMWQLDGFFVSGPRTDLRRSASFNYYRGESKAALVEPYVAMLGEQRTAWKSSFELSYEPAEDWWSESLSRNVKSLDEAKFVRARPEVLFLFAVEDIDVPTGRNEQNQETQQRGLRAFGLLVDGGDAALVEVSEPETRDGFALQRFRFVLKKLASVSGVGGKTVAVSVEAKGKKVSAKVGGKSLDATLAREVGGFSAFAIKKPGFVSIEKLKL